MGGEARGVVQVKPKDDSITYRYLKVYQSIWCPRVRRSFLHYPRICEECDFLMGLKGKNGGKFVVCAFPYKENRHRTIPIYNEGN